MAAPKRKSPGAVATVPEAKDKSLDTDHYIPGTRRRQPSPHYCGLINHLYDLGPRAVGELLLEVIGDDDHIRLDVEICLERYRQLDPDVVHALGADSFPPPPIHEIVS